MPTRPNLNEDFPLRGAITYAACQRPVTGAWSKSKTGRRHAYYLCFTKGCAEKGESIRRDRIEAEFTALLKRLTPAPELLALVRALFTHGWE